MPDAARHHADQNLHHASETAVTSPTKASPSRPRHRFPSAPSTTSSTAGSTTVNNLLRAEQFEPEALDPILIALSPDSNHRPESPQAEPDPGPNVGAFQQYSATVGQGEAIEIRHSEPLPHPLR